MATILSWSSGFIPSFNHFHLWNKPFMSTRAPSKSLEILRLLENFQQLIKQGLLKSIFTVINTTWTPLNASKQHKTYFDNGGTSGTAYLPHFWNIYREHLPTNIRPELVALRKRFYLPLTAWPNTAHKAVLFSSTINNEMCVGWGVVGEGKWA